MSKKREKERGNGDLLQRRAYVVDILGRLKTVADQAVAETRCGPAGVTVEWPAHLVKRGIFAAEVAFVAGDDDRGDSEDALDLVRGRFLDLLTTCPGQKHASVRYGSGFVVVDVAIPLATWPRPRPVADRPQRLPGV